ncbi:uncharacterized protein I303_105063 [Kwoniella dejecticola CBS 10117]|uniref:Borealin N-terminal domain-containing protein n=1 Tax=Kwoniella dejecticola CBS 10117 TaxID=1296121 RepID=A0A1A6A3J8_9TREE|nr:uncharacterized protein I303_05491 [Kwoniella dejecticola CBS 10117]OBR84632.1 hypothetical protein I303_05491 [Kwoniella dejecticola CBS 10117]
MASTKTRRAAPNVIMSTPPPQRSKSTYSDVEKQGLLANFDIEVADKTLFFRSILSRTLASFRMREESEILSIPRELRGMTLGELESKWGGGWAGTLQRIRRESFEKKEKVREEKEEKERDEVVRGKRKRNGTASTNASPERGGKNPRRDAPTPASTRKAAQPSTTRSKASAASKKGKAAVSTPASGSSSKGPSTLPQNHIFNPTLPPTPFFSSKTHSPLSQPSKKSNPSSSSSALSSAHRPPKSADADENEDASNDEESDVNDEDDESQDDDDEDEDELPDPELLEAKLMKSTKNKTPSNSKSSSSSSRGKKKRGPSLIFRQSLAPGSIIAQDHVPEESGDGDADADENANIHLSDGRIISFNPFNLTPGRVEKELNDTQSKLSKDEKKKVQEQVHELVVKSLRERMERWKV